MGKNIFIGALTVIVRGSWRDTVIGDGCKIANRVTIGHNVILGKNCLIAPGVVICGSAVIGDNTRIYANAVIKQRVKIPPDSLIGPLEYVS